MIFLNKKLVQKKQSRIERVDNLKIKNLFFRYKDDTIFKNFNYTFKKGSRMLFMGKMVLENQHWLIY